MLLTLAAPACSAAGADDPADASLADTGRAADDAAGGAESDGTAAADGARPDTGARDGGADATLDASPGPSCADAAYYPTDGPREAAECDYFKEFPCGLPPDSSTSGCFLILSECAKYCTDQAFTSCFITDGCDEAGVIANGPLKLECSTCKGGRRPDGLQAGAFGCEGGDLGDFFARTAHLEAASIAAFHALREELRLHGAPRALTAGALRSARDEVRHTRATSRLARRFGARPCPARVTKRAPRSLEAMAIENAVEGCVRETFGALLALWQAAHAEDAEVRRAMETIADDETRHAALAWSIAAWADARLDDAARARVRAARAEAVETLRVEAGATPARALVRVAGLPEADRARAMVDAMATTLLS